jgi:opacity protein-like surface antigen
VRVAGSTFDFSSAMRTHILVLRASVLSGLIALAIPGTSSAQPVPNGGQVAVGGDIGVFLPSDDQTDGSFIAAGLVDYYFTPRLGIRGSVATTRPGYTRGTDEQERQIRLGADIIYNWEMGKIHPFAGGGLGIHFLRFYNNGDNVGPNDEKAGVSGLGGVEVFLNREWTFKLEGRYQWVDDRPLYDPDGFALTFGIKRYF